eukprot:NODE_4125_length_607_cov_64.209677_g2966_i0.p7 GENE.NODE_4125_length_607_cov_64.209677_g2966_i0~~NODE_4125_length_607_cov_64.209677_g2966_i0.p7  ORF type:complete len:59 (+),score=16.20 NODE_4125_length_607_cov_64.209677_g2966_i0:337-513(+)
MCTNADVWAVFFFNVICNSSLSPCPLFFFFFCCCCCCCCCFFALCIHVGRRIFPCREP